MPGTAVFASIAATSGTSNDPAQQACSSLLDGHVVLASGMALAEGVDPSLLRMWLKPAFGCGKAQWSEVIEVHKERLHGAVTITGEHPYYQFAYTCVVPPSCFFRTAAVVLTSRVVIENKTSYVIQMQQINGKEKLFINPANVRAIFGEGMRPGSRHPLYFHSSKYAYLRLRPTSSATALWSWSTVFDPNAWGDHTVTVFRTPAVEDVDGDAIDWTADGCKYFGVDVVVSQDQTFVVVREVCRSANVPYRFVNETSCHYLHVTQRVSPNTNVSKAKLNMRYMVSPLTNRVYAPHYPILDPVVDIQFLMPHMRDSRVVEWRVVTVLDLLDLRKIQSEQASSAKTDLEVPLRMDPRRNDDKSTQASAEAFLLHMLAPGAVCALRRSGGRVVRVEVVRAYAADDGRVLANVVPVDGSKMTHQTVPACALARYIKVSLHLDRLQTVVTVAYLNSHIILRRLPRPACISLSTCGTVCI